MLFDPPEDQREMIRHYTLSATDLAMVNRGRGDSNRLGRALMICYLRYPGRPLRGNENPPERLVAFVSEQIGVFPQAIDGYLVTDWNRRTHAAEFRDRLRLQPFGRRAGVELASWLLPKAIEDERLMHLAELVLEECRQRRIVLPGLVVLERLCIDVRHQARRKAHRRLTGGLTAEQRRRLDALTQRREDTSQTLLTWLRQMPEAARPGGLLGVIERLNHVREIGIEPGRGHQVHQARLA